MMATEAEPLPIVVDQHRFRSIGVNGETMATLTSEQKQEIQNAGEHPVAVEDPETHVKYVILKADVYERLQALLTVEKIDPSCYEYGEFISLRP